ncbi:hypothetical protein RI129_012768 [Pyrocoelia pectoralis]|uniref:LEM domain-containing protein n=1 Tax=Pyrocoelia pectoralis TaxID=417401 RepID=A0AAN7V031_9COLE
MVDVESLSDAELRTKLIEFGYPIMPITGTTRKLMQKKLKILLDNKNDGRRSLGRYSSEEESDTDVSSTRKSNRRVTMGAPSPRYAKQNDSPQPQEVHKTTRTTTTTRKVVKTQSQDEFDTGSDSEPEIIENNSTSFSPLSQMNFEHSTTKYSRPRTVTSSSNFSNSYSTSLSPQPLSSSRFTSTTNSGDGALDRLNQIRSRLSLGSPTATSPPTSSTEDEQTPFLSNFTRRLSQLSNVPKTTDYDYKSDIIKEYDTNGAGAYTRTLQGRQPRYRDVNQSYYTSNAGGQRNNMISIILLSIFCLFFVCLGVMYYGMRDDGVAVSPSGYYIPHCNERGKDAQPGFNCIHYSDVDDAVNLMHFIKPELIKRAVSYGCKDSTTRPFLTEGEVLNLRHVKDDDIHAIQKQLENMEVLAFRNPDWCISMVPTDVGNDLSEEDAFRDMEALMSYKNGHTVGLAVLNPDLPLRCRFYNKVYTIFNLALVIFGTFLTLYLLNMAYKYVKRYHKHSNDEVYSMVRRIVDVLESSGDGPDDFLVINHVRDMILPIMNRKSMEKIWMKAVKFINENESRVRTEVQVVQGEPFEVWRWLGNPSLSSSPRSKTWQGQAFETQVGSVNSLPCSPTPCLKIRGMMDDNDRNPQLIREAVLGKCAHQCRILHCGIDDVSKCVYLKCADQNDAAVAYQNLHGWWCSGHLVTVKYLRLERYMQRFPNSPVSGPPYLKSLTSAKDWSS